MADPHIVDHDLRDIAAALRDELQGAIIQRIDRPLGIAERRLGREHAARLFERVRVEPVEPRLMMQEERDQDGREDGYVV